MTQTFTKFEFNVPSQLISAQQGELLSPFSGLFLNKCFEGRHVNCFSIAIFFWITLEKKLDDSKFKKNCFPTSSWSWDHYIICGVKQRRNDNGLHFVEMCESDPPRVPLNKIQTRKEFWGLTRNSFQDQVTLLKFDLRRPSKTRKDFFISFFLLEGWIYRYIDKFRTKKNDCENLSGTREVRGRANFSEQLHEESNT